jgi:hypothetical protein
MSLITVYGLAVASLCVAVNENLLPLIKVSMLEMFGGVGLLAVGGGGVALTAAARWRGKHSWAEVVRYTMLAPRWWFLGWPRKWSPAGVGDRLPKNIKRWRAAFSAMCYAVIGITIPAWIAGLFAPLAFRRELFGAGLIAMLVSEAPMILSALSARRWGMKQGLSEHDSVRAIRAPLWSTFWKRPSVAAVLLPDATTTAVPREPQTPHEILRAIGALAQQLGSHFKELTDNVSAAARDAINEIDALDVELATLAAEASPAEVARLEERLAGLSADSQLRALLTNQLALLRSLATRLDHVAQRRARVVEMLRTMWLQLANLRASHGADTVEASAITGRIRALCASVAHEISADREVAAFLKDR